MSQLRELRRILLEEELQSIDELRGRIDDHQLRTHDVAEILPAALRASDTGPDLVDSLREPVGRVIHDSVRNDPDSFADALFPVMGPAIRKAVAESIRALADRINQTVEQSVSFNGLKWRVESVRTGVPLADIIVRETLLYEAEEIFVIHRDSGMLLAHLDKDDEASGQDSDAVSAMLTAIQDFVRDSFGATDQGDLDAVQIGSRTVWISYGPQAMLAVVYSGNPPVSLRAELHAVNEAVHRQYADAIEQFDGDRAAFSGIEATVRPLLKRATRERDAAAGRSYKPLIITVIVIGAAIALWFIHDAIERARTSRYLAALAAVPGIVVLDATERDGATVVRMLRDPMAEVPADLASTHALDDADIVLEPAAFLSSDPVLVLARVRQLLEPPATVTLDWEDGRLVARGTAPNGWLARARSLPVQWSGVAGVDFQAVQSSELRLLEELRARYEVPDSVEMTLAGDTVRASGTADIEWLLAMADKAETDVRFDLAAVGIDLGSLARHLRQHAATGDAFAYDLDETTLGIYGTATFETRDRLEALVRRFGLEPVLDTEKLRFVDVRGFDELRDRYRNYAVYFSSGVTLTDESARAFERALPELKRLAGLGAAQAETFLIRITGYTDGSGRPTLNETLRERRARYIAERLVAAGVPAEQLDTAAGATPAEAADDRSWRRVMFDFE